MTRSERKASEAESNSESDLTREIIRDWVERANISFQYTKKKASELVKKAKEKMKKSNCNYLECPQCNESFPSEDELRKHFVSEEHLAKVREKSESKTYGDLKTFAGSGQNILSRALGAPASSVALRVETPASSPPPNPPSPRPPEETIATDVSDKLLIRTTSLTIISDTFSCSYCQGKVYKINHSLRCSNYYRDLLLMISLPPSPTHFLQMRRKWKSSMRRKIK